MVIEWVSIALVAFIMMIALGILKIIEKNTNISGEAKRKLFHITMGLVVLTFPYLFKERLSVVIIGIVCILIFIIMKHTGLKKSIGTILYSVDRESLGEIFFAVSVVLIFYWTKGDKILYSIPILLLTFADSTAALIGKNYGKKNLAKFNEDAKSIEGSFMFFMVAFILTLVPLLLFTNVGRAETLIISTIIGFNVALIEMISHTGNDNLLIPLTTYAFLITHINLTANELKYYVIGMGIIFVLVNIANRIKSWSKLALVEAIVVGYLTVALYGIYAVFPPLMLFLTCLRFPKITETEKNNIYDARIIETNIISAITVCAIAKVLNLQEELFMIYCLCYSMHLAINTFIRLKYYIKLSKFDSIFLSFLKGLVFIFIPSLFIGKIVFNNFQNWYLTIFEVFILFMSVVLIYFEKKNIEKEEISLENGYKYMNIVVRLTGVMLLIEFLLYNLSMI